MPGRPQDARRPGHPKKAYPVAFVLPQRQQLAVDAGREALVAAIEKVAPPDKVMPLIGVAAVAMFCDFLSVAGAAGDVVGLLNSLLEPAGLELVQHRHRG